MWWAFSNYQSSNHYKLEQSYRPAPFFVLDEVDAALDRENVDMVAKYFKDKSVAGTQFVLISLKDRVFAKADALVGIYVDVAKDSSRTLTLDLSKYGQELASKPARAAKRGWCADLIHPVM